jgi:hypothetical protein
VEDEKNKKIFLHHYGKCEHCNEVLVLSLSENMKKYGFICPYCKTITPPSRIWDALISYKNNRDLN